jgi:hypothetical protein
MHTPLKDHIVVPYKYCKGWHQLWNYRRKFGFGRPGVKKAQSAHPGNHQFVHLLPYLKEHS